MNYLKLAALSSFLVSLLHLIIIFFLGADGYRQFGAGEEMARMAEAGDLYPHILSFFIALVFALFALYALSGNQKIKKLPFLKPMLLLIAFIYLIRALGGIPVYFLGNEDKTFVFYSSLIPFLISIFYLLGIKQNWDYLKN